MKNLKTAITFCSMAIFSSGVSTLVQAETNTEFRGKYFSQSFLGTELRSSGVRDGVLLDDDLIRGNSSGEAVITLSTNPLNTNPFEFFNANTTERSLTVLFDDGGTLRNVRGLFDRAIFNFGTSTSYYLISEEDLTSAGRSIDEVIDVEAGDFITHQLDWSDFGFVEIELPDPESPPTEDNIILGTDDNDRLVGTDGVDVFISGGGARDRITGGEGGDFFVVGTEVGDGIRNIDVIRDFEPGRDALVIGVDSRMSFARARNGRFIIEFQGGDRDRVVLRNTSITNSTQFEIIRFSGDFDISDLQR